MAERKRFWSSVPGVVTGVASVVTATVGLIGAGVTLGWFGNKDSTKTSAGATTTSVGPGATLTTLSPPGSTGASGATPTTSLSPLTASPSQLTFDALGSRSQQVTVRNATATAVTLRPPNIAGVDSSQFDAKDLTCGGRLDANRTCLVLVTFLATKTGTASATLVVEPVGPPAVEVPLKGSRLL